MNIVIKLLTRLRSFWRSMFTRQDVTAATSKKPAPVNRRKSRKHEGVHYYLGDLLDSLDDAFEGFRAFKAADPDAYKLFSQVGAAVSSSDGGVYTALDPYFKRGNLPAFACVHLARAEKGESDTVGARFIYLQKINRPINVQPSNLPTYRIGAIHALKGREKAVCSYGAVAVSQDGTVSPLKECAPCTQRLPNRGGKIVSMRWSYGRFGLWAKDRGKTVEQHAQDIFSIVANLAMQPESGLTVRVSKGKHTATFSIDMLRTPYFFADRDKTVNENGRTKRILHIVRGHQRTGADGKVRYVKPHFRGLRRFTWNGYSVAIGMAGKHFVGPLTFTAASSEYPEPPNHDWIDSEEVGRLIHVHTTGEAA